MKIPMTREHRDDGARRWPEEPRWREIMATIEALLLPEFHAAARPAAALAADTRGALAAEIQAARQALGLPRAEAEVDAMTAAFEVALPEVRRLLLTDLDAAFAGDPAATSVIEVALLYPGFRALVHHRVAHLLLALGAPLLPRLIAELAHAATGIDLHPGARIGEAFFIDHGTGVVIGETTIIGDRVRIYQGVTLGSRSFPTDESGQLRKGAPRHPILGNDVVVYAGASVLGRISVGDRSIIGCGACVRERLPPGSVVLGPPQSAIVASRREAAAGANGSGEVAR